MSNENPYESPKAEVSAVPAEVHCKPAKAKIPGTRHLAVSSATIRPLTRELRLAIYPGWAFPISILIVALVSLVYPVPVLGLIVYVLVYSIVVILGSRSVSFDLSEESPLADTDRDVFVFKKRRKGRSYSLAFQMTPESYKTLEQVATEVGEAQTIKTSNFWWHVLAFLVIVGVGMARTPGAFQ